MKRYVSGPDADVLASEEWVEAVEVRLDKRIAAMVKQLGAVGEALIRETGRLDERITDLETLHYRGKYPARHNYIEPVHNEPKHTCGECAQPFRRAGYQLSCFEKEGCRLPGKSPQWRLPTDDACSNFEAKKGAA